MTYIIVDLVILALLLFAAFRGYQAGMVLTLCGLLAYFVAIAGAVFLSNALTQPVAQLIQPAIQRNLEQTFQSHTQAQSAQFPDVETGELPLSQALELLRQSPVYQSFVASFQQAVESGVAQVTENAAQSISTFVARQVAKYALMIVGFFGVMLLWTLFARTLDFAAKLPVLNAFNHWGGALFGLLTWGVFLFLLAPPLAKFFLTPEEIQQTRLLSFFCTVSPLSALAGGLSKILSGEFITSS